jgi:DNA-directed RNA polymerase beta subunit
LNNPLLHDECLGRRSYLEASPSASVEVPGMIANQRMAFEKFISVDGSGCENTGLQRVLESIFPIIDGADRAQLEFISYSVEKPGYDERECTDVTYAAKIRIDARFIVWAAPAPNEDGETPEISDANREVRSITCAACR